MLILTLHEYRKRKLSLPSVFFWSALWIGLIFTGLFPESYVQVTSELGMNTPIQFVTSFSVVVIFVILFQTYTRLGSIERKVARLAQELTVNLNTERVLLSANSNGHVRRPKR